MNAAFVRVLKVTNFPKFTGSSLCGYRVLVRFLPKDEGSYGTLDYIQNQTQNNNKEDYLTSQVTWNFLYDDANTSYICFSFFYDEYHFANLKLPLIWFESNAVVRYSFPARLLPNVPKSGNEGMMVKVVIHRSENKELAFLAPKGNLLVTPKWKTSNTHKAQQNSNQYIPQQQLQSSYQQKQVNTPPQPASFQPPTYNQYPPLTVSESQQKIPNQAINQQSQPQIYQQAQQLPQNQYQTPPPPTYQQPQQSFQQNIQQDSSQQQHQIHTSLSPYSSQNYLPNTIQSTQSQVNNYQLPPNQSANSITATTQLQLQQPQPQSQPQHISLSPNQSLNSVSNLTQSPQSPSYPPIPLIPETQGQNQQQEQPQLSEYNQQYQLQQSTTFIPPVMANQEIGSQNNQNEEESFSSREDDGALDNLGFAQDSDDENDDSDYVKHQIIQTQPINQIGSITPNFQENQQNYMIKDQQQQQQQQLTQTQTIPHSQAPKINYPPFPAQMFPIQQQSDITQQDEDNQPKSQPVAQYTAQQQQSAQIGLPMVQYLPPQQQQQPPPQAGQPVTNYQTQQLPVGQPAVQYPAQQPQTQYAQPMAQYQPQPQPQPLQYQQQNRLPPPTQYAAYAVPPPPPVTYYQRQPYQPYAYQYQPYVQPPPPPPQTGYSVIVQSNRPLNAGQQYIVRQPPPQQPQPQQQPYQYAPQYAYQFQYTAQPQFYGCRTQQQAVPPPPPQTYYTQPAAFPPIGQATMASPLNPAQDQQRQPQTAPKRPQYTISPLPPGTPTKVNIPPPVTFDPSKTYSGLPTQLDDARRRAKSEKTRNSQQLGAAPQQIASVGGFGGDSVQQQSTSMLEDHFDEQQGGQTGDKIVSIGNDGFDSNNALKPLNVPTSNFSTGSLEKGSNNPIMDDQKQSYFLPQYPSE